MRPWILAAVALAVAVAVAVVVAAPAAAETPPSRKCVEPAAVELDPAAPTTQDAVRVGVAGTWPDACVPSVEGWSREGEEIVVLVEPPEAEACALVLTGFDLSVDLGQLPAGTYRVGFESNGLPFCDLEPVAVEVSAAALPRPGLAPAATLLIPRFEVDLATPAGSSTFVAVGNVDEDPVLSRVTLWTDWGIPTFAFDLALAGGEVRTFALHHLLAGAVPPVSSGDPVAGCPDPGPPDAEALATLVLQHTGRPHPADGLCYGSDRAGSQTAVGYLTIDAVNACSATSVHPTTAGYFAAGGTGVASNRNVLWGDYFYVDEPGNSAQGLAAVPLVADAEIEGESFYGRYLGSTADGRAPLGSTYRARYLSGGAFDGGTDLILWLADSGLPPSPSVCGEREGSIDLCQSLGFEIFDLEGRKTGEVFLRATELSTRLTVNGVDLPASAIAGYVEVANSTVEACILIPTGVRPLQLWVTPVLTASGRFSVALEATRIE